ncbi:MAG: digeranylgeranylglycerophospholipid reductase [Thermoanaerobacter sp.]|uniref:NAD(P)/FAD-dependent oxidoreductase n=1 Tax=Desulfofundulus thermocisternus TaxID=42471 RepID=UPI0006899F0F|nr:NAD(P)/FAD-dependent oxidoreductase [Desulfofundulus thermocisternus]MDK2888335.1 digeranylgeranylglycerophospholipid reductase [Thermoanaerobacter sp.]
MRVAIIGAGPSGLACALELQRQGVKPVIFERFHRTGHPVERVDILLNLPWHPVKNQLAYLARRYHLQLHPLAPLRTIIMHSPGHRAVIRSRLGHLLYRGRSPLSIENQLAARLTSPVIFETIADPQALAREYDWVVVATGDSKPARQLGLWQEHSRIIIRGALILGKFEPHTFHVFWDTRFAKHGYGYLAPFDSGRACLYLMVGGITPADMDDYWELFLESKKLHYPVVQTSEMEFHTGRATGHRVGNILLVGNSGGFFSNLLGLGLFPGMISGVLAARAILRGDNYERLIRPLIRRIEQLNELRCKLDKLDNRGLDRLVGILGMPGIKQLIYYSGLDVIPTIQAALTWFDRLTFRPQPAQPRHH